MAAVLVMLPCKFVSAESIADSYFPTRLSLYHDRKSVLQSNFATALSAQVLFAFKLAFSADLNHNRLTNLNYGRDCVGA